MASFPMNSWGSGNGLFHPGRQQSKTSSTAKQPTSALSWSKRSSPLVSRTVNDELLPIKTGWGHHQNPPKHQTGPNTSHNHTTASQKMAKPNNHQNAKNRTTKPKSYDQMRPQILAAPNSKTPHEHPNENQRNPRQFTAYSGKPRNRTASAETLLASCWYTELIMERLSLSGKNC